MPMHIVKSLQEKAHSLHYAFITRWLYQMSGFKYIIWESSTDEELSPESIKDHPEWNCLVQKVPNQILEIAILFILILFFYL